MVDAFIERELEGESREAICRDLDITPENLSVRLFRARLMLRRCLERHWFGRPASAPDVPQTLKWATASPGR